MSDTVFREHSRSGEHKGPRVMGWAAALVLLTVLTRLPALVHPRAIDDETIYSVVAMEMVDGGKPYVDAVERKPPLLFWMYAGLFRLGGKYNWFALHATAVLWTLLTMAGLYVLGRQLFDDRAGLAAALLYSVYQSWALWKNLAFNGEVLMNLPVVWAVVLALRPRRTRFGLDLLAAGALLCLAFLLKQPAAAAAVPIGVYLLLPSYRRARQLPPAASVLHAALLTVGFFSALGLVAVVLESQGILREAFFWTITAHDVPHGPTDPVFWIRGGRMSLAFAGVCAPLFVGALWSREACGGDGRALWDGRRAEWIALVGLGIASAIGTAASGRFYPHYFIQLVVPLAILAAPVYACSWTGRWDPRRWFLRPLVTKGWLALTVVGFFVSHWVGHSRRRESGESGRYIRAHSGESDRIFVWGQSTGIYLDARRRPASRYVATFPLTGYIFGSPLSWDPSYDTSDRIVPGAWDNLAADFASHPPLYIVDADAARVVARYPIAEFPWLDEFVKRDYEEVRRAADGVILRRMGSP